MLIYPRLFYVAYPLSSRTPAWPLAMHHERKSALPIFIWSAQLYVFFKNELL